MKDILFITGTPGSVILQAGDHVGGQLTGMETLHHPVLVDQGYIKML
ncbi:hypothetical protein [Paenibacillus agri]|uniref:Uncharacterized protein n=1 Tax=Paenibacillus agri TaxID=2744309 RepID=A0A850EL57_9BACL|nr:hypothetical protein [Paenibacillus agri]NUU60104.1 hypothetical protein [Paenibacillus agri]